MNDYIETKMYLCDLIQGGLKSFESLRQDSARSDERKKLISIYLSEVDKLDKPIFEISEPSLQIISNFLKDKETQYKYRAINEITDTVFHNKSSQLEAMFEDMYDKYLSAHGVPSDREDWERQDNRERYIDITAAL